MQLDEERYQKFLEKALYPCVRVRSKKAGGSGQVIHSTEKNGTFILTCQHVIDDAIDIKEEWSSILQKEVKKDVRSEVDVEFFKYAYKDRAVGCEAVRADIVAYDKNEDIAILRLKDPTPRKYVAELMPTENIENSLNYFDEVVTIGAALGHPPICTIGNICAFNDIIDNRDYIQSTAPSIFGNCIPGDALITMADGRVKRMKDIEEGDYVLSYGVLNNELVKQRVEEFIESGEKEIYEIKTRGRTLRASGNHPVLTVTVVRDYAGRNVIVPIWKRIEDLQKGDLIAVMSSIPLPEHLEGFNFANEIGQDKSKTDFMRFLGFYLGDGYSRVRQGYGGELSLYTFDVKKGRYYKNILEDLFDVNVSIVNNYEQLRVSSIELARKLEKWGVSGKSHEKTIPDWVMTRNAELQLAFIHGYLDSDGYINTYGDWVFEASSKDLIERLRMMCIHLGIPVSNIFYRNKKVGQVLNGRDVIGKGSWLFQAYPHFSKNRNPIVYGSWSFLPRNIEFHLVNSKKYVGIEMTYDIKLKKRHTFFADGVLVHNSGGATFLTKNWKLIGMPARIAVVMAGFSADAITHLGYIVPFWRIRKFFEDQMLDFLYDDSVSYDECMKKINERRKKGELEELLRKK